MRTKRRRGGGNCWKSAPEAPPNYTVRASECPSSSRARHEADDTRTCARRAGAHDIDGSVWRRSLEAKRWKSTSAGQVSNVGRTPVISTRRATACTSGRRRRRFRTTAGGTAEGGEGSDRAPRGRLTTGQCRGTEDEQLRCARSAASEDGGGYRRRDRTPCAARRRDALARARSARDDITGSGCAGPVSVARSRHGSGERWVVDDDDLANHNLSDERSVTEASGSRGRLARTAARRTLDAERRARRRSRA